MNKDLERMHSRVQQLCRNIGTKESVYIRKELNSHRIGLVHQHSRRLIVLEIQYGCHDVMCIRFTRRAIILGCLDIIKTAKQFKDTLKLEPIITGYMH